MSGILGEMLNKVLVEHEDIVKNLESLTKKTISHENEKLYVIELFENRLNNLKEQFSLLAKHYEFSMLESIMLKSTIELIFTMTESFVVNASNRGKELKELK